MALVNVIKNGCFSEGWTDIPPLPESDPGYYGQTTNQEPKDWELTWIPIGGDLYGSADTASGVAEIVHKLSYQLPENERQGGSDPLILCGGGDLEATFKIFHMAASYGAEIRQTVSNLKPGTAVSLIAPMRIHDEDKNSSTWDAESGAWIVPVGEDPDTTTLKAGGWKPLTDARKWDDAGGFAWFYHGDPDMGDLGSEVIELEVPESGAVDVVVRVKSKWVKDIGFFIDGVELLAETNGGTEPPPEPEPEPVDEGMAREPYNRIYHVASGAFLSPEQITAVYGIADNSLETVGPSFDDSGIGTGLKSKTAVLWNVPQDRRLEFIEWFATHYPSTELEFRTIGEDPDPGDETPEFALKYWPTAFPGKATHWFGEGREGYVHGGTDLVAPTGSPVIAPRDGYVYSVTQDPAASVYGIHVWLDCGEFRVLFAHLQEIAAGLESGTAVSGGSVLGLANNTGNSFGSHLHFEIRVNDPDFVYTDPTGREWLKGKIDSWLALAPLWDEELKENGRYCYLWNASLERDQSGLWGIPQGALNARVGPSSSSTLLGQVATSSVVAIIGDPVGGYVQTLAIVENEQGAEIPLGIHWQADGGDSKHEENFAELRLLPEPKSVKLMTSHTPQDIQRIAVENPLIEWTVRIFLSFGGRYISAQQFYKDTINDLRRTVDAIPVPNNRIYCEIHNEPNLYAEGQGSTWSGGSQFGGWLLEVFDLFKADIPDLLYTIPAMSPGGSVSGIRVDAYEFVDDTNAALGARIHEFDAAALHGYWSEVYPMSQTLEYIDRMILKVAGLPVIVTEASNNKPFDDMERARQYVTFWEELRKRPYVRDVNYFVMSGTDPAFASETWITTAGESKGIAQRIHDIKGSG